MMYDVGSENLNVPLNESEVFIQKSSFAILAISIKLTLYNDTQTTEDDNSTFKNVNPLKWSILFFFVCSFYIYTKSVQILL